MSVVTAEATARIRIGATGGSGGITGFSWSPGGMTTRVVGGLTAGTYTVTVTDGVGCTESTSITVTEPPLLEVSTTPNNPNCFGTNTAFAVVSATGGTLPYDYLWSTTPPQTGTMAVNLSGGTYTVTVTDANNCTVVDTVTIIDPEEIVVTTIPGDVTCFEGSDGMVEIRVAGGVRPFSFTLNGIYQTDSVFTGLTAGSYNVVVEDNNGCTGSATFTITSLFGFDVELGPDVTIVRGETHTMDPVITITPPSTPTGYLWTPDEALSCTDCAQPDASPDSTITYVIRVEDSNGCFAYDSITVIVLQEPSVFIPTIFSPNGDGLNDYFHFNIKGASNVEVRVFNRWGEEVYYNASQANGTSAGSDAWDGSHRGEDAPLGVYVYQFGVTYFDGTTETLQGSITLVR